MSAEIKTYGTIRNMTESGKAVYANQVYDETNNGFQSDINSELLHGKQDAIKVVNQVDSSVAIRPNVLNVWGVVSSLTITLIAGEQGNVNEYMFQFTCPTNATTTLTLPSTVKWANNTPLEPEYGYVYQVSIVDNLAIYAGWAADSQ